MNKSMMLVTSSWGPRKTFKLMPITPDAIYNEGIFDPDSKVLALIGKEKKGIKTERALFVQKMIAKGFVKPDGKPSATVDTYWMRVKEASGYVPKGRVTGGTDVDAKTVTELKTIINRIFKAEEEGQDPLASQFKGQLMEIFEGLGGDVDTLG